MSNLNFICKEGTPEWLEARKEYITASSAYTLLEDGNLPKWWSTTTQDVIDSKFYDKETEFDAQAKQKMWYGTFDEENNMRAAQEILGVPMSRYQWLVNNPKWEHLAGTPDGLAMGDYLLPPNLTPTSVPKQVEMARERIQEAGGVGVVELKNTRQPFRPRGGGPASWYDYPPAYYADYQVQFQLHLTGLNWGLLVGKMGGNDMAFHFIRKSEGFALSMDKLNNLYEQWEQDHG